VTGSVPTKSLRPLVLVAWAKFIVRGTTTLKRDVALKVLPDAFAHNPERLARFQREDEVLASLNHRRHLWRRRRPRALVMEFVEGESLAGYS
jgi:serine/threonine protein kinase